MIPVIEDKDDLTFDNLDELKEELSLRRKEDYISEAAALKITPEGKVRGPEFEFPLTRGAYSTLLPRIKIPERYASQVCPDELFVHSANILLANSQERLRIRTFKGVITSFLPSSFRPVDNELLVDMCMKNVDFLSARLNGSILRITTLRKNSLEPLKGDLLKIGWELTNSENGFSPLSLSIYLYRLICRNGLYGMDHLAGYSRKPNSDKAFSETFAEIRSLMQQTQGKEEMLKSLEYLTLNEMGRDFEAVKKWTISHLGVPSWRLHFSQMESKNTWYEFVNTLTLNAQRYPLNQQRQYEFMAGEIISHFLGGRRRRPWASRRCNYFNCEQRMENEPVRERGDEERN